LRLLSIDDRTLLLFILTSIILSLIYAFFQYIFKFHQDKKVTRFFFFTFTFLKAIIVISLFVIVVYFFYSIYNSIDQYLNLIELKKYVKNLSKERVLAKIIINEIIKEKFKCTVELYSLTGKIFKTATYELNGNEFYIDFVVLNFDYVFIEKGANNIAYPNVIFSEEISYDNGIPLLTDDELKSFLSADSKSFLGLSDKEVNSLSLFIFKSIKNSAFAKKIGIRSIVGSALHHIVSLNAIYKVYLENTGGIVLIEENF